MFNVSQSDSVFRLLAILGTRHRSLILEDRRAVSTGTGRLFLKWANGYTIFSHFAELLTVALDEDILGKLVCDFG